MRTLPFVASVLCASLALAPATAAAFCGFYVAGGDAKLYNNATMVVLMRDGARTVLSMQNNYQGPPADFAMVVPVPVVLQKEDVKTLPREIFERVDRLAAPRLVEYWEVDPCWKPRPARGRDSAVERVASVKMAEPAPEFGVRVEAEFTVGEYEVVILSAEDATGLDGWLKANDYKIPEGAEAVLRPYVQGGMKFFVARVDVEKVKLDPNGQTMLSPLRFHYDSESFNLPVRLGLLNSAGDQDLLIHILAKSRYEVANYPNVFIPTNLEVTDAVRAEFGKFYVALFDAVLRQNPKAVVTEYAWQASSCDPCPDPSLSDDELRLLGADALPAYAQRDADGDPLGRAIAGEFVLTRLHARYGKDALGEDLVFQAGGSVTGGGEDGQAFKLPQDARPWAYDNRFQARYIIRHLWDGPIECRDPIRGRWGPPPREQEGARPRPAQGLAFADRSGNLSTYVAQDVPAVQLVAPPELQAGRAALTAKPAAGGCGCDLSGGWGAGAWLVGLAALGRRRRVKVGQVRGRSGAGSPAI